MPRIRYVCMPGSGFTGSTLLGFLLNAHPDCVSIGAATGLIGGVDLDTYRCSCGARFVDCPFWKQVRERTAALGRPVDPYQTGFWTTHYAPTRNRWLDALLMRSLRSDLLDGIRDRILLRGGPVRRRALEIGETNVAFARAVGELTGKSVFVDSARDHQRPRLLAMHPGLDVFVIHLLKDARANVASIRKHFPDRPVEDAARDWRRANVEADRGRRRFPPERWMRLHYATLCRDPQGTLDRIADFVGVRRAPLPGDFRAVEHHIIGNEMRVSGVGQVREDRSWQERLSAEDLAVIARVAGDANRHFGFDWP